MRTASTCWTRARSSSRAGTTSSWHAAAFTRRWCGRRSSPEMRAHAEGMAMNTLQSLVLPNLEVHADAEMYVRHNDKAWASLATPALHFAPGGVVSTDTFYNGLTVGAWKRHCTVRALVLRLVGEGQFVVTIGLHRLAQATVWLGECSVQLRPGQPADLPLDPWEGLRDGLLFIRARAMTPGRL